MGNDANNEDWHAHRLNVLNRLDRQEKLMVDIQKKVTTLCTEQAVTKAKIYTATAIIAFVCSAAWGFVANKFKGL